jgi:hypothetical protein
MTFVLGRGETAAPRHAGRLGRYRALDGSPGAPLYLDVNRPHAMLVVGKRGYGKSYTLGVIAEELARAAGVAPTIIDPMGIFRSLTTAVGQESTPVPASYLGDPAVSADTLDPKSWCSLLGLAPDSGAGSLVWHAAQRAGTVAAMRACVRDTDAPLQSVRAACNHLDLAASWDVFDPDGIDARTLGGGDVTVLDVSGLDAAPMNAVCRGVTEALYRARVDGTLDRLPWLLVDEAHTLFEGVARESLRRLLQRGRAPGVSLVAATQRPTAIPEVGISQSDILVSHRLTAQDDIAALETAQPTYMTESLTDRMPTAPGDVAVIDDATETVHAAHVRERETPHGGDSPRASAVDA